MIDDQHFADTEPPWDAMTPCQRAAIEANLADLAELDPEDFCSHCGKEFSDFSDLGCGYCDRRNSDWGMMP